jgi:hypothetical protein
MELEWIDNGDWEIEDFLTNTTHVVHGIFSTYIGNSHSNNDPGFASKYMMEEHELQVVYAPTA